MHARRISRVVVIGALAGLPLAGAAQAPQGPTLRASVDQVIVDVVVTDQHGTPVTGLTAADFELRESGRAQVLNAVVEVGTVAAPAAAAAAPPPAPADRGASTGARIYVLLLDDYHVGLTRTAEVRLAARAFLDRYVVPGDLVGVRTSSGLGGGLADPTVDRGKVAAAIERFVGRGGAPLGPVPTSYRRGDGGRNADRMASARTSPLSTYDPGEDVGAEGIDRARDTLRVLARTADALAAVPGRKTVLFFSEGIAIPIDNDHGLNADVEAALSRAALANVVIYAFDPRGLSHIDPNALGGSAEQLAGRLGQATRDRLQAAATLRALAERSGGLAFIDRNDTRASLAQVGRDSRHHYLIGYVPADARRLGRFRAIDVRVARPGVTVRARKGYVEPKDRR